MPITGKGNGTPLVGLEQSKFNWGHPFLSEVWFCQQKEVGNQHRGETPVILTPSIPEDAGGILDMQAKALACLPCDLHLGKKYD